MSVEEAAELIAAGEDIFFLEAEKLTAIDAGSKQLLKLPSCP
jgi:hypothetical protein